MSSDFGSLNDIFSAFIAGDQIYWTNGFSEKRACGLTNVGVKRLEESLDKALTKAEEYKEMCIAAGLIQRERTPEEIAKEAAESARIANENSTKLAELLSKATATIDLLASKIETLENNSQLKTEPSNQSKIITSGGKK